MCISTIIGRIIFGYPTVLSLAFLITPDPCNGIEYHTYRSREHVHKSNSFFVFFVRYKKMNLT